MWGEKHETWGAAEGGREAGISISKGMDNQLDKKNGLIFGTGQGTGWGRCFGCWFAHGEGQMWEEGDGGKVGEKPLEK